MATCPLHFLMTNGWFVSIAYVWDDSRRAIRVSSHQQSISCAFQSSGIRPKGRMGNETRRTDPFQRLFRDFDSRGYFQEQAALRSAAKIILCVVHLPPSVPVSF